MAIDGQPYAVATGEIVIGGFGAQGDAASVQKNLLTVGRIPNGATIVAPTITEVVCDGRVQYALTPTRTLPHRRYVAAVINGEFPGSAYAVDAAVIAVRIPPTHLANTNEFISVIEHLEVVPDISARIVVNENTGTVVIGDAVRISRVAITHGGLSIITSESPAVSQPLPFSDGETTVVPRTQLDVLEERNPIVVIEPTVTVGDLAQALNAMGATPRDLISILQTLKAAGALHAELITQ